MRPTARTRTRADLTDDALLEAAGPAAALEVDDSKPPFATPEWFEWMDRHFPAKSDQWFYDMARRARERAQNRTATAAEWAALAEWRRYRAEHPELRPNPAWPDNLTICSEPACRNATDDPSGRCSRCRAKAAARPPAALKEPARA